eukprot:EG_transcript_18806
MGELSLAHSGGDSSDGYHTDCEREGRAAPRIAVLLDGHPRPPKVGPPVKRIPRHLHARLPVLARLPQPLPAPAAPAANALRQLPDEPRAEGRCARSLSTATRSLRFTSLLESVGKRASQLLGRSPAEPPTFDHVRQALGRLRVAFDPVALETLRHYAACKVEPHAVDLEEVVTLALRSPDHWTAPLFDQMLFEHLRFGPSDDIDPSAEEEGSEEEVTNDTVWPHDSTSQAGCRGDFRRFRHALLSRDAEDDEDDRPPIPTEVGGTESHPIPVPPRGLCNPLPPRPKLLLPSSNAEDSTHLTSGEVSEAGRPALLPCHPPAGPTPPL